MQERSYPRKSLMMTGDSDPYQDAVHRRAIFAISHASALSPPPEGWLGRAEES